MAELRCCKDSKSKEKASLRQGYVTKTLLDFEDNGRDENQRMVRQKYLKIKRLEKNLKDSSVGDSNASICLDLQMR